MVTVGRSFQDAVLKPRLQLVRQFADELADVGVELAAKARIVRRFSGDRLKLGQGIRCLQSRCGCHREGADYETLDPCSFVPERQRRRAGLGDELLTEGKNFIVKAGAAGEFDTACEK